VTDNKEQQKKRLIEKLTRECGEVIMEALKNPQVNEIMLNPDGKIWLDIAGKGMHFTENRLDASAADSILATCASMLNTSINYENPILEGEFPLDGSRLAGLIFPVVNAPTFAIRKKATSIFTLDDYKKRGILPSSSLKHPLPVKHTSNIIAIEQRQPIETIRSAISKKQNILVVGGTSSGKTTLTNSILHELSILTPEDRLITIEDTMELQINVPNYVSLHSSEAVSMQRLLRATMRLNPTRIAVGEVRGGEAFTLLKSWNSGHPGGVATIHANSAVEGLDKLAQYIFEAKEAQNFSPEMINRMIASTVNFILFIEKTNEAPGRSISEIVAVQGYSQGQYHFQHLQEIKRAAV
jgi:Flp pilus assembly CpaF family ATPase